MGATNLLDEWRGVLWGAPRAATKDLCCANQFLVTVKN